MSTTLAQQNKQIAMHWFEAFNEHDLEKLLALYHKDAEHFSPKLNLEFLVTVFLISD